MPNRKDEPDDQATEAAVTGRRQQTEPGQQTEAEQQSEPLAPPELGPVVPEGEVNPQAPEQGSGEAQTGVQPVDDADIPDAGR